jgi:ArsR family transcriptional regulator, arsenate/arsenite/antimonite-responsive transcriptional repressor
MQTMPTQAATKPRTADPSNWSADCCPSLSAGGPLDRDEAERLSRTLKAVADPARLQVLSILRSRPDGEACACDLVEPLGLAQPTVSHHLKVLYQAGLLEREKRATWVHYRLPDDRLPSICQALI